MHLISFNLISRAVNKLVGLLNLMVNDHKAKSIV